MLRRSGTRFSPLSTALLLAFLAARALAPAQSPLLSPPAPLPPAPQPQLAQSQHPPLESQAPAAPLLRPISALRLNGIDSQAALQDGIGRKATDMSPAGNEHSDAPIVTMAPHPDNNLWWISGQANIIFQGDLPFHSPYQGANSFTPRGEYKTSMVGTLYTALRRSHSIRYNTDFVFDLEAAEGRGLGEALGIAGFTNLDVVRNPNLGKVPYIARYQIHQTIGLTNQTTSQDPGFFALAPSVPVRRLDFRIGKLTLPDFFDVSGPGSDSHLQFLNWTIDNNGAWDYAADTRGYTVGGIAEYDDRAWSLRYGIFTMPVVANGIDMDWALSRAHGQNGEFELRHSFVPQRKGVTRVLFFANRAHMGTYREAVDSFLNGSDTAKYGVTVPTITLHEHFSALKYGLGYNTEQEITENLRVFARFGWNEGQHESFAYTEVDQTVEAGADYSASRWRRPADKIGLAVVTNAIKRDHQEYLKLGGLGFLLGDGRLNYGRENIVEAYYTYHFWRGMFYSLDIQHIDDPGYNRDRGPVWVGAIRAHVDF
jgi:high affinity Mn2+ porin